MLPRRLRDPERPLALSVVFWLVIALVIAGYVMYDHSGRDLSQHLVFVLNVAALLALWPALPWGRVDRWWRGLFAPGFLLAAFALGFTGSAAVHFPLVLVGFAAIALAYGTALATGAVAATGALMAAAGGWLSPADPLAVAYEVAVLVLGAAFVLGMVAATQEARRRRVESERLLGRIRELTVAEERARMARDMHDSMGHHLTAIKMGLENAERFRRRRPEAAWDEVRQSKELTARALAETRRWVRALRPLDLEGRVGSAALDQLARSFDGSGVNVDFEVSGQERRLDSDTELVLYRVLQEGLTNVLRHAEATRVRVRLNFSDTGVALSVGDNGRGAQGETGFGLTALSERVAKQGGRLRTGSSSGNGFELRAELPVMAG